MQQSLNGSLCFMSLNWVMMQRKLKMQLITEQLTNSARNFAWVVRILTIRQDVVNIKPWSLRQCSKSQTQIWCVALREYQVSSASQISVLFIPFMTLAKVSRAAKLCHMEPKYWKTFDLILVFYHIWLYIGTPAHKKITKK